MPAFLPKNLEIALGLRLLGALQFYIEDGDNLVVIGSKGGSDSPPAWLLNLLADPNVDLQIGTRRLRAVARIAKGAERERLWEDVNAIWPQYRRYQDRSSRRIPVVVLQPAPKAARLASEGGRVK